jgi:hypothetical protein
MESGRYIGGATRARVLSRRASVRVLGAVLEGLILAVFRVGVGLYFFRKEAALAFGGFPESLLIAEDMSFARNLKSYGRKQGLRFCNLRTVTIQTLDRKDASVREMSRVIFDGLRVYLGSKPSSETLKYWYQPKR